MNNFKVSVIVNFHNGEKYLKKCLDSIINQMNIQPGDIPDLDNISIISGDTDRRSNSGITMNL